MTGIPYRVIYEAYISSSEWRSRRAQYFTVHKKKCLARGSTEMIDLHHRTYDRFTQELDQDLVPLCQTCHKWVHHLQHTKKISLEADTVAILSHPRIVRGKRPDPPPVGRLSGEQFMRQRTTVEKKRDERNIAKRKGRDKREEM